MVVNTTKFGNSANLSWIYLLLLNLPKCKGWKAYISKQFWKSYQNVYITKVSVI